MCVCVCVCVCVWGVGELTLTAVAVMVEVPPLRTPQYPACVESTQTTGQIQNQ